MILSIKISGKVDNKFKNEHQVMEKVSEMFTNITFMELKQMTEVQGK